MDDDHKKIIEKTPLIRFSLYTVAQVQTLKNVGEEIIDLSKDWTEKITNTMRVYDLFWLWVLGTYEVLRTMDQHKACFSAQLQIKIGVQKRYLADIRMPFAKQEMRGSGDPVYAELSISGFDGGMVFDILGTKYNSTNIVEDFIMFIDSIKPHDIVSELPVRRPK